MAGLLSWLFGYKKEKSKPYPLNTESAEASWKKKPLAVLAEEYTASEEVAYINWTSVGSSWIAALRFNPTLPAAQMKVKKASRKNPSGIYTFGGMTKFTFLNWIHSGSKGRFFNRELLGRFTQYAGAPELGQGIKATKYKLLTTAAILAGEINPRG